MSNNKSFSQDFSIIEILRFFTIVSMLIYHGMIFLHLKGSFTGSLDLARLIGIFAGIIPCIAGFGLRIQINSSIRNNKTSESIFKYILLFAYLSIINLLLFWLVPIHKTIFPFEVLPFIGLSFLIIILFSKISIYLTYIIALITLILTNVSRNFLHSYNDNILIGLLIGNAAKDLFWPIFPWFFLVGFGFLIGDLYFKFRISRTQNITGLILSTILLFILKSIIPRNVDYIYPPITYMILLANLFMILLFILKIFFSKTKFKQYGIINSYSKGILFIYFLGSIFTYYMSDILIIEANYISSILNMMIFSFLIAWIIGALVIKIGSKKIKINLQKVKH